MNFLAVTGRDAFPVLGQLQDDGVEIDAYWADDACIDEHGGGRGPGRGGGDRDRSGCERLAGPLLRRDRVQEAATGGFHSTTKGRRGRRPGG